MRMNIPDNTSLVILLLSPLCYQPYISAFALLPVLLSNVWLDSLCHSCINGLIWSLSCWTPQVLLFLAFTCYLSRHSPLTCPPHSPLTYLGIHLLPIPGIHLLPIPASTCYLTQYSPCYVLHLIPVWESPLFPVACVIWSINSPCGTRPQCVLTWSQGQMMPPKNMKR